jgi:hypothetical protein
VAGQNENPVTEYHVRYTQEPYPRWEVQYGGKRMGYKVWDQRVATNAARELARANRPSKVIIHNQQGDVDSEIDFPERAKKQSRSKS